MTQHQRIGDVASTGDLIGTIRESVRANLVMWAVNNRVPLTSVDVSELAELLARNATQAIVMMPINTGEHPSGFDGVDLPPRPLPRAIAAVADDLQRRMAAAMAVPLCPGCGAATHASESDDSGRCADCVRAAGETPLLPNQE